jgi:hypothetical protein
VRCLRRQFLDILAHNQVRRGAGFLNLEIYLLPRQLSEIVLGELRPKRIALITSDTSWLQSIPAFEVRLADHICARLAY